MIVPENQKVFERMFSDEHKCLDYLFVIKYPNGFICEKCEGNEYWLISKHIRCKNCKSEISITSGTIFQSANLKIQDIFRIIWWIILQKNGVSARSLERVLGISYKSVWYWLHRIRKIMILPGREKLSGKVEVDEIFIGGKSKGKRGRGSTGKSLVATAVEIIGKGTGRTRFAIIQDASRKSLNLFIKQNVNQGSTIITDAWKGYVDITKMKYNHIIENQSIDHDEGSTLPHVHRIASLLKRWLLGTHQSYVNKGYLEYYLDEFVFRYNRRKASSRGKLFYTLIYQAMNHEPILYEKIHKNTKI
jgi:transposase-like protein